MDKLVPELRLTLLWNVFWYCFKLFYHEGIEEMYDMKMVVRKYTSMLILSIIVIAVSYKYITVNLTSNIKRNFSLNPK